MRVSIPLSVLSHRVANKYLRKHGGLKCASPDEPLIKWLSGRAEKKKGIVQIPVVEKAFSYLEGWSIEPTTTYVMFNGNYDLQDMLEKRTKPALEFNRISRALSVKEHGNPSRLIMGSPPRKRIWKALSRKCGWWQT